jgi:putative ABC transport system permease protein
LALRSVGQNKKFSRNFGISIKKMTLFGLMLSHACIGFGGALFSQYQGFADISQGLGTIVMGSAAILIGERLFPYRSISITLLSCFIGSVVYRCFIAMALHSEWLGLESQDLNLITGLMILIILALPRRRHVDT